LQTHCPSAPSAWDTSCTGPLHAHQSTSIVPNAKKVMTCRSFDAVVNPECTARATSNADDGLAVVAAIGLSSANHALAELWSFQHCWQRWHRLWQHAMSTDANAVGTFWDKATMPEPWGWHIEILIQDTDRQLQTE